jgi:hypothetical protein
MKKMWMNVCMIAFASLALVATGCGDDASNDGGGTTSGADTSGTSGTNADTSGGGDDTSGGGDDTSGGGDGTSSGADTSGTSGTSGAAVPFDFPANPEAYVTGSETASAVSYVKKLALPSIDEEGAPTCCAKFPGSKYPDDPYDNGLAALAPLLAGQLPGGSLDATLAEQIENGTVVILWDHIKLDGATDADGFILAGLLGKFAEGTTFDGAGGTKSASAGAGEFKVDSASFKPGTGEPLISFNPVGMNNGRLQAGPGPFRLELPILGFNLSLEVSETQVTGSATISAAGVSYVNGTLSGYVKAADIFAALNQVAGTCGCLGLRGGDLIVDRGSKWECSIEKTAFAACKDDPVSLCDTLSGAGQVCDLLGTVETLALDLDLNGDGRFDALSIGLLWEGATGAVTGVAAE